MSVLSRTPGTRQHRQARVDVPAPRSAPPRSAPTRRTAAPSRRTPVVVLAALAAVLAAGGATAYVVLDGPATSPAPTTTVEVPWSELQRDQNAGRRGQVVDPRTESRRDAATARRGGVTP